MILAAKAYIFGCSQNKTNPNIIATINIIQETYQQLELIAIKNFGLEKFKINGTFWQSLFSTL